MPNYEKLLYLIGGNDSLVTILEAFGECRGLSAPLASKLKDLSEGKFKSQAAV